MRNRGQKTLVRKFLPALILFGLAIGMAVFGLQSTSYALDTNKCLSCHSDPNLSKVGKSGEKISLYVNEKSVNTGAHRYIDCATCHTTDPHKVDTPLTKLSLAEKCGTCHQYEYQQHRQSIHGQQLAQGNADVATCVDCHSNEGSPHSVIRVLESSAPAYKKNIAQTCAKCHNDEEMMSSYGVVEKVYESYMRSFHGKAIQLGNYEMSELDKATCTNCHGTHDIKSLDDPNSPVASLDKLTSTCAQCHTGAGAEFARGFLGHREASPDNNPPVHWAEVLFKVLLTTVLAFGAIIVAAAIIRFALNKWRV